MRINHNLMAMNTNRQLGIANKAGSKSMEKLSSGFRINRASDDAAGLSISEKMRNQIRGLERASANSQDGISLIQTAEGALDETHAILKRMRELTVQAGNEGTLQGDDLEAIKDEFIELASELDGIADRTEFNGKKLLDGSYNGVVQIGANQKQQLDINVSVKEAKGEGNVTLKDQVVVSGKKDAVITNATKDDAKILKDTTITATKGIQKITIDKSAGDDLDVSKVTNASRDAIAVIKGNELIIKGGVKFTPAAGATPAKLEANDKITAEEIQKAIANANLNGEAIKIEGLKDGDLNLEASTVADLQTDADKKETTSLMGSTSSKDLGVNLAKEKLEKGEKLEDVLKAGVFFGFAGLEKAEVKTATDANLERLDAANKAVSKVRSHLGANQNRLEHTIRNLDNAAENVQASESRIRDVDMAKEMIENTKQNILQQASTAMLAQANQAPQTVLRLLG